GSSSNGARHLNASHSEDSVAEATPSKKNSDDEDDEPQQQLQHRYIQLTNQHKSAIRAIRKVGRVLKIPLTITLRGGLLIRKAE
ncbi:hypothetical protein ILUMI_24128, partial [Ignelater luminosus]